ncbi:MAG: hypothetical protein ACWGOD_00170 [Desulfobulbales bacterium]
MIKDYSGGMILVSGRNRIITPKRKNILVSRELFPATKFAWKTIGAMLLTSLIIGITSTIWYGLQVRVALDQIGNTMEINSKLYSEKKLLTAQRDLMLTPEHMKDSAYRLGLVYPVKNQLRYP